ncbi:MAG: carboxypeptidase-like regulatory domain-containing protein, partial [Ginsengibacter sp.]
MRKFMKAILILFLLQWGQSVMAQQRAVTGKVVDENNNPLAAVTVLVKGTSNGTQTDANGNFTIRAKENDVLVVSTVGYSSQDVRLRDAITVTIRLAKGKSELEEVVVTAMDIKRSARSLPYSAQTLGGRDIRDSKRENFVN